MHESSVRRLGRPAVHLHHVTSAVLSGKTAGQQAEFDDLCRKVSTASRTSLPAIGMVLSPRGHCAPVLQDQGGRRGIHARGLVLRG